MTVHTVSEVDVTAEEEHAALSDLLTLWRERFPEAGLFVAAVNIAKAGERREAEARVCHSNANATELIVLADRALEQACAMLATMPFTEADVVLAEAIAARQALGFLRRGQARKEMD